MPAWINKTNRDLTEVRPATRKSIKLLIIGGCDLYQVTYYLKSKGLSIETEFNYNYNEHIVHREHSELLRGLKQYTNKEKQYILSKAPFYDSELFSSKIYSGKYDIIVYSPLIDFSQGVYENKTSPKLRVTYGNLSCPLVNKTPETFDGSNKFIDEFIFLGKVSPDRFLENLNFIRQHVNKDAKLILLNGSEQNIKHPEEPDRYKVHIELNAVIKNFCCMNNNTFLLDVNKYIHNTSDHTDNIRHYSRKVYYNIATELVTIINGLYQKDMMAVDNKKTKSKRKIWIKTMLRRMRLYDFGYHIFRKIKTCRKEGEND